MQIVFVSSQRAHLIEKHQFINCLSTNVSKISLK